MSLKCNENSIESVFGHILQGLTWFSKSFSSCFPSDKVLVAFSFPQSLQILANRTSSEMVVWVLDVICQALSYCIKCTCGVRRRQAKLILEKK